MKLNVLSAAVLGLCLCAPAFADCGMTALDEQSKLTQDLLQYDTNGDGIITLSELVAGKTAEFTKADTDGDGFLTWAEFKVLMDSKKAARLATLFKVADKNSNGAISSDEFLNVFAVGKNAIQAATVFAIMDTNSDGALSPDELTAALAGNEPVAGLMWQFAGMDTDGDAKLSLTEYTAKLPKLPTPPKLPVPSPKGKH